MLLRFDRFLQSRAELAGKPLNQLIEVWGESHPSPNRVCEAKRVSQLITKAMRRLDPAVPILPMRIDVYQRPQQRRPYVYSDEEIQRLLKAALAFPSPKAPLRPLSLYTMALLAYCAGLRVGEIVALTLADVNLQDGTIEIRETKFFKNRRLPLAAEVIAAVKDYLAARQQAGAPTSSESDLFWNQKFGQRYSYGGVRILLVEVLRRAGLKPTRGRIGPRIHDLRHTMVGHRMRDWYKEGINPQSKLPHLATYLGHKDITSTLVYLNITPELLHEAERTFSEERRSNTVDNGRVAMKPCSLANLLHAFFHEWMGQQRNLSRHTVLSYRDTWKLLLCFVSERKHRQVTALSLSDLEADEVLAFLQHLEHERKVSVGTRNCRLAAIHSFFAFVARREPLAVGQCGEIARIPIKKMNRPAMCYLDTEEITAILRQPDRSNPEGQRDHAFLALLYNTGARIQEALNVCPAAIRFESPAHVSLFGKGRKTRVCPLWSETVDLLRALLRRQPRRDDQPIFVNCYGRPLSAAGVRFKLKQYVQAAARQIPSLARKRVGPHTFRHSVGVQLVAAGVDVTVIRNWLGHARLDTTNLYARANLETKRKALEQVDPATKPSKPPRWKQDPDLLTWLDSL